MCIFLIVPFFFCALVGAVPSEGPLTLSKVAVKGSFVGKDRFAQLYLIEPGDPFDQQKHEHSLEKIKEELMREGYLAPHVTAQ
nr:hypothetical protein [Candidatus Dependentiae bacterium]